MGQCYFLVKLQTKTCNFTKNTFPRWMFFTFFNLHKWYQIAQSMSYLPPRSHITFLLEEEVD